MIELCKQQDCTGCSACMNACNKGAISMLPDIEGFLHPVIDNQTCVECGLCIKSCPILNPCSIDRLRVPDVYAAINKDISVLKKSSSGGLFSAFAKAFFESDSDKSHYLVAADFDEHLILRHRIVSYYEEIYKMRGSKYVQSNIQETYKETRKLLRDDSKVLFVGTPCQIAGLYSFLRKDYSNLFTIDLVCHGVPSPGLFWGYLNKIGIDNNKEYQDYHFRDFDNSTFLSSYYTSVRHKVALSKHSYIAAYLKGWLHRDSCYSCRFTGIPRQADISIGDFWGILSGKISYIGDSSHGVSVVLVNSSKGRALKLLSEKYASFVSYSLEDALIDNHNIIEPDTRPSERESVYKQLLTMNPKKFMRIHSLSINHTTGFAKTKQFLKSHIKRLIAICLK